MVAFIQILVLPARGVREFTLGAMAAGDLSSYLASPLPSVIGALHVVMGLGGALAALAIYERLRAAAPTTVLIATTAGLAASVLFLGEGISTIASTEQLGRPLLTEGGEGGAVYRAVLVMNWGLFLAAFFSYGIWVILVASIGLRRNVLPKTFCWVGLLWGIEAVLAASAPVLTIPVLGAVWSFWLGIILLTRRPHGDVVSK